MTPTTIGMVVNTIPEMTPASDLSAVAAVPPFSQEVTRAIIRQVEFYFSDQNLPSDAHLLGLSGNDGTKPVSLNEICGWRKMRDYKPRKAIKNVLALSAVLEVVDNGKKVKRRFPLQLKLTVKPKLDLERRFKDKTLSENPHLTKGMLKATGFEEYYADAPVTPLQYEQDRARYDLDFSFEERIETAIRYYLARRKMHQMYLHPFNLWMNFGGIDTSPAAFQGGLDADDFASMDKEEIAAMRCPYTVDEYLVAHDDTSSVDFKRVALAFLSTQFPTHFQHDKSTDIDNVCNVMCNFFNYLLHHDVCPEYTQQLYEARAAVHLAMHELHQLPRADRALRSADTFNQAAAQLHDCQKVGTAEWDTCRIPMEANQALVLFKAGLAAYSSEEQLLEIEQRFAAVEQDTMLPDGPGTVLPLEVQPWTDVTAVAQSPSPFLVVNADTLAWEVVNFIEPEAELAAYFDELQHLEIPRMSIMHCRQWTIPGEPVYAAIENGETSLPEHIDIIVEDAVLRECAVGLKFQAHIKQLDTGLCFISRLDQTFPSFFDSIPDIKKLKQLEKERRQQELQLEEQKAGLLESRSEVDEVGVAVDAVKEDAAVV